MHDIEPFFNKYIPKSVRFIFSPMLTLLVVTPIGLIVLGPLGTWLGDGLGLIVNTINNTVSWLVPTIIGAFTPLLVMCGMHYGIIPIGINYKTASITRCIYMPQLL